MFRSNLGRPLLAMLVLCVVALPTVSSGAVLNQLNWTTTTPGISPNGLILDLQNNALIFTTGAGVNPDAVLTQVQAMVRAGWNPVVGPNQGSWTGTITLASQPTVITSTAAANDFSGVSSPGFGVTAMGVETGQQYLDNAETVPAPLFFGHTVTPNMVLLRYTFYGDTNLKGSVDPNDLANALFGAAALSTGWAAGGTDYSTNPVGPNDLANILFSNAAQAFYSTPFAQSSGSLGGSVSVPEPSSIVLMGIAVVGAFCVASRVRRSRTARNVVA